MLKWPDAATVRAAVTQWAQAVYQANPGVVRLGYFGSYARGNWGVGSDVDLVAILAGSDLPFERRSLAGDLPRLPVPADLLIYTAAEWERLRSSGGFARTVEGDVVWLERTDGR